MGTDERREGSISELSPAGLSGSRDVDVPAV